MIDTGQHAGQTRKLRGQFGMPSPDAILDAGEGIYGFGKAGAWSARILANALFARHELRTRVFAPGPGVCVIHGDTFTTLLMGIVCRAMGIRIAHVESGLRSFRWFHPFPEEIVRVVVNRWASLLLAPGEWAAENLRNMCVRGRIVTLPSNTGCDALRHALDQEVNVRIPDVPYAVASIHRFETVTSRSRVARAIDVVRDASRRCRIVWPMHEVFATAARRARLLGSLNDANVEIRPILDYIPFAHLLSGARFVIADGGSIQEESWFLDKPCLLLRHATERREGLGENVLLSDWDADSIKRFLNDPSVFRRENRPTEKSPSAVAVDAVIAMHDRLHGRRS